MQYIRFVIAFVTCLCFASAGIAGTQMRCCTENAQAVTQNEAQAMADMPCHGKGGRDIPLPHDNHEGSSPLVGKAGCGCVCSLQTVMLPVPDMPERQAVLSPFDGVHPLPPLDVRFPIEAPPKPVS